MKATVQSRVITVEDGHERSQTDSLAVEEPMEIRVNGQSIAVTMRTPGHDFELAAGFLLTEGVIARGADIRQIRHCARTKSNVVRVELSTSVAFDPGKLSRHVFTTSSCGVCGKTSLDQVRTTLPAAIQRLQDLPTHPVLCSLPGRLREQQAIFTRTGGLHAAALFDTEGNLLSLREDVGRHNAMDKLVGALLMADRLPAGETLVLVSGRASFELVQKAAMAGIPMLAAVGAPSSLAVDMAREFGMMLIGFLRDGRFNIYSGDAAR